MKHFFRWMAALVLLACAAAQLARADDDFLPPEQAFKLSAELRPGGIVHLAWAIAPGYHLYRDRLVFAAPQVGQPALPDGVRKFDSNFNKEMETYAGQLAADLPVKADSHQPFVLRVGYQGCADAGLCYPPAEVAFKVDPAAPGALTLAAADAPATSAAPTPAPTPAQEDDSSLAQRTLRSGSAWRIGLAFLAFGLLL